MKETDRPAETLGEAILAGAVIITMFYAALYSYWT